MTVSNLRRLGHLWQRRLRITDWKIEFRWSESDELKDAYGTTQWDPRQMTALVVLRHSEDQPEYPDGGIEQTLIHELLHLVLQGDRDYEQEDILQERAINQIADALFWAYHSRKRK